MEDKENERNGLALVIIIILFTLIITLGISCLRLKFSKPSSNIDVNNSTNSITTVDSNINNEVSE